MSGRGVREPALRPAALVAVGRSVVTVGHPKSCYIYQSKTTPGEFGGVVRRESPLWPQDERWSAKLEAPAPTLEVHRLFTGRDDEETFITRRWVEMKGRDEADDYENGVRSKPLLSATSDRIVPGSSRAGLHSAT